MKKILFVLMIILSTLIFSYDISANTYSFLNMGEEVTFIETGGYHSGAITSKGNVYTWGGNDRGQLGDNTTVSKNTPVEITTYFSLNVNEQVKKLAFGQNHSMALTTEGRLFTWGNAQYYQTGVSYQTKYPQQLTLSSVLTSDETVKDIFAGSLTSGIITTNDRVILWGYNEAGTVGANSTSMYMSPTDITPSFNLTNEDIIVSLKIGQLSSVALSQSGRVFTWGDNRYAQIGDSNITTNYVRVPYEITSKFGSDNIVSIDVGAYHGTAVSNSGKVYMWGSNNYGELGTYGLNLINNGPMHITANFLNLGSNEKIVSTRLGDHYSSAFSSEGKIYIWGRNEYGQLGFGNENNLNVPTLLNNVFNLKTNETITAVALGETHSSILTSLGRLFFWGRNHVGQLGNGSIQSSSTPRLIPGISVKTDNVITFNTNRGSRVDDIVAEPGETLSEPVEPTRDGFTFEGWYSDQALTTPYVFITMPNEDLTVYAKWNPNKYMIYFATNGGSAVSAVEVFYGSIPNQPEDPTRTHYEFLGWKTVNNDTQPFYNFDSEYALTSNQTLYAFWSNLEYEIVFNTHSDEIIPNYVANLLTSYTLPQDLEKTGYTFQGWYLSDDFSGSAVTSIALNQPVTQVYAKWQINQYQMVFKLPNGEVFYTYSYDYQSDIANYAEPEAVPVVEGYRFLGWETTSLSLMPASNIELVMLFELNSYTLSFETNGGLLINHQVLDYITMISLPTPSKTGYSFVGWFSDEEHVTLFNETNMPASDVTVYAGWQVNQYTITFNSNGGSAVVPFTADYQSVVTAPTHPTRTGYTFIGWSSDIPSVMPAEDITLDANWQINQYTITFNSNGGSAVAPLTADYQSVVTAPTHPTRTGYTFIGWSSDIPSVMPAEDITLDANWQINQYTIAFDSNGGSEVPSITKDFDQRYELPSNPTREGFVFNGWSEELPSTMPAENIVVSANWLKLSTESETNVVVDLNEVLMAISSDILQDKNAEIVLEIKLDQSIIAENDKSLINEFISRNQSSLLLDISLFVRAEGSLDEKIETLNEQVLITLFIPLEQQGFKNYQIVRVHQGEVDVLDTTFDEENQTLTFETNLFSTYAIVYEVNNPSSFSWWYLLLLLIPAVIYYVYNEKKKQNKSEENQQDLG